MHPARSAQAALFQNIVTLVHCSSGLCRGFCGPLVRQKFSSKGLSAFCPKGSPSPANSPCPMCLQHSVLWPCFCPLALTRQACWLYLCALQSSTLSLHTFLQNFPDSLYFKEPSLRSLPEFQATPAFSRTQPPCLSSPEHLLRVDVCVSVTTPLHGRVEGFVLLTSA